MFKILAFLCLIGLVFASGNSTSIACTAAQSNTVGASGCTNTSAEFDLGSFTQVVVPALGAVCMMSEVDSDDIEATNVFVLAVHPGSDTVSPTSCAVTAFNNYTTDATNVGCVIAQPGYVNEDDMDFICYSVAPFSTAVYVSVESLDVTCTVEFYADFTEGTVGTACTEDLISSSGSSIWIWVAVVLVIVVIIVVILAVVGGVLYMKKKKSSYQLYEDA